MAVNDWIKMRGALINAPKLIRVARHLQQQREFREWLTPGGGGPANGRIVSDPALRAIAFAALGVTWSAARQFGHFAAESALRKSDEEVTEHRHARAQKRGSGDLFLDGLTLDDIDHFSGCPCIGRAMESVGWAIQSNEPIGVTLPEFKTWNTPPMTGAERQEAYRTRNEKVTQRASQKRHQRERESKSKKIIPLPPFPEHIDTPEIHTAFDAWLETRPARAKRTEKAMKLAIGKLARWGPKVALEALENAAIGGWQGLFHPDERKPNARPERQDDRPPPEEFR